ncbi:MAG: hypothetical protein CVU44_06835 [Chloroflexi bacterium HGW-Chloroflexi-6]|nr:MAG: hypothetical protein CVU44_06835 [Chloroflexi bacterium HGW-Chloroflexi-6]
MTAIFGIIKHDNSPLAPDALTAAAQTLGYHAQDGLDTWQDGSVALGQALTRFWHNSAQSPTPERDHERGLTLIADARLDNRNELAEHLSISRGELYQISDSRLLLHAYKAWGEDCPQHLLGDFVFAVWDSQNQRFFAARDQIGIRWLYFSANSRQFSFASDIAGLLDLMDEAPRIDMTSLDEFLTVPHKISVKRTFYENIHKVQPGQALQVQNGTVRTWYYWQAENIQPNPDLNDPRQGVEILRDLLKQAVSCRAETVDRLGTHLSGGLDSSAITALAVDINRTAGRPDPLAFSWSPPLDIHPLIANDERIYVERIAQYLNILVTYTHVPPQVDVLHETSDPSTLPLNANRLEQTVMENARQQESRVLLSGWGGDELVFSRGIGYPSGLIQKGRWLALARYLKYQYGWHPQRWVSGLYAQGIYPLLSESWQIRLPARLGREHDNRQGGIEQARNASRFKLPSPMFFQPDFYARLERNHKPKFQWIQPGLRNSQLWYLTILLNRVESWAAWSARLGMRHAYPLLDKRLVEFALSMPEDWIYYGGKLRELGKQAVANSLSPQYFEGRDKQDRALFANQPNPDHQKQVRNTKIARLTAQKLKNPPSQAWLDFKYMEQILHGEIRPNLGDKEQLLVLNGFQNVFRLAFIDHRARIGKV